MKGATKSNLPGEGYIKKSKEALSNLRSLRENFIRRTPYGRSREEKIREDLEKAGRILGTLGQRFKW